MSDLSFGLLMDWSPVDTHHPNFPSIQHEEIHDLTLFSPRVTDVVRLFVPQESKKKGDILSQF